MSKVFF